MGAVDLVAPHTGAWIETDISDKIYDNAKVAPHTGAWIETKTAVKDADDMRRTPHGCVD